MAWRKCIDRTGDNLVIDIVDDTAVNEGTGRLITLGALAFLLGSAGVVHADTFKSSLRSAAAKSKSTQSSGAVPLTKGQIGKAVQKSARKDAKEMVGAWEKAKAINVVARTLYMEARGEGTDGMKMVMTVIWNRAGGDKTRLASVCLERSQFSCWNGVPSSSKSPSTYAIQFPKGAAKAGADQTAWNACVSIAKQAFSGKFTPTNAKWNSYYATSMKVPPSWADELVDSKVVGNHTVGELKWLTKKASRKGSSTYTVKAGDTLWGIAGKDMDKVARIKELNGLKSDVIKPGQVLKMP